MQPAMKFCSEKYSVRWWVLFPGINIAFLPQLFPGTQDQTKMEGESPYNIMFGPDICGPGTKKVHVIFSYKGKNLLVKKDIRCKVSGSILE